MEPGMFLRNTYIDFSYLPTAQLNINQTNLRAFTITISIFKENIIKLNREFCLNDNYQD